MAKITKTASNKYHSYVFMGKDANGKRIIKSVTDSDRRVVAREVERLERLRGTINIDLSFSDAIDDYIHARKSVLSPATIREYSSTARMLKERYGAFCALATTDIDKGRLQRLVNEIVESGASPKRVRNIYGVITAVLRNNDIPVSHIALPEMTRPTLHEPTKEDIRAILDAVSGTSLDIPVRLGIHGLRLGEICALEYPADFGDGFVHVNKSLAQQSDYSYVLKPPKNITSNRYVPISEDLLSDINRQGYVTELTVQVLSKRFAALIKRENLPHIRFHDLRHFFASYMHELGYSDAKIMKMGGWATDNVMKRVYRYAFDDKQENKKIADLLSNL